MQNEHSQPDTTSKDAEPQPARSGNTSLNQPSRDMFGGPWLGVIAFVVIAIGLGWGVAWFFSQAQQAADDLKPDLTDEDPTAQHGFDPDVVYLTKRDLLLGYTADGRKTLFPAKGDLPRHAYGRRSAPTLKDVKSWTTDERNERDLIGIVEAGTPVRFVEVIEDPGNGQTKILLLVELIFGPYASRAPVLGMHLESADSGEEGGPTRLAPRPDLFESAEPVAGPVQSDVPAPTPGE